MSFGFDTALSALTAARNAIQAIGHNVSNANTPGYTRQRVLLGANAPQSLGPGLTVGTGVRLIGIEQVADAYINDRIRQQTRGVGLASVQRDVFSDLESAFGEPGDSGLNAKLSSFFGSLQGLSSTPGDVTVRSTTVQQASTLAKGLNALRSQILDVRGGIVSTLRGEVGKVNQILDSLGQVNRAVLSSGFGGQVPADIKDQQNELLKSLSEFIDVRATTTPTGQLVVSSAGQLLVNPTDVNHVSVVPGNGSLSPTTLRVGTGVVEFKPQSGRIRGLLDVDPTLAQDNLKAIDDLARGIIQGSNHAHATGVPPSGGYTELSASNAFVDRNGNGSVLDEKLSNSGLPFDVKDGYLTVSVKDDASGATTQRRIQISSDTTTVQNLRDALASVPHVNALVDTDGHLRITSDQGYRFDFSGRTNPTPDTAGTFGTANPVVVGSKPFPVDLSAGGSFSIAVDGGTAQTVNLLATSFANPAKATAAEVAAAVNAQVTGASATVVDGRLVITGQTTGSAGSIQVTDGPQSPAAALGLGTTAVSGQATAVKVGVSGNYTGTSDQALIIKPLSNGTIGVTPNLKVEVRSSSGVLLGNYNVGQGYAPGDPIDLGNGLKLNLAAGAVSATAGQFAHIDAVADGDGAGVLTAVGLNSLFTGADAGSISVNSALTEDPSLLATGRGGGASDNSNVLRLLAVKDAKFTLFDGLTIQGRYDSLVTQSGFDTQRATNTLETQQALLDESINRRQEVSGVNIDEELLSLENFQRTYEVAAKFTQTLSSVNDTLVNLLR